jgi:hypothetical protein
MQLNKESHMRLHSTITSPYARKVWVVAHETGLISQIERIPTNPHADEYASACRWVHALRLAGDLRVSRQPA